MPIKLLSLFTFSLLLLSFNSKAADKNYTSFITAVTVAEIDNELEQAKTFNDLKIIVLQMYMLIERSFGDSICPPPNSSFYKGICADVALRILVPASEKEYYEYYYEKRIFEASCIDVRVDDDETIKGKLKVFWNKFHSKCKCDSLDFNLSNSNFLKYALSQKMPDVIETFVPIYGLDITFIDPADGKTLQQYVENTLSEKIIIQGPNHPFVKMYREYAELIKGLISEVDNNVK